MDLVAIERSAYVAQKAFGFVEGDRASGLLLLKQREDRRDERVALRSVGARARLVDASNFVELRLVFGRRRRRGGGVVRRLLDYALGYEHFVESRVLRIVRSFAGRFKRRAARCEICAFFQHRHFCRYATNAPPLTQPPFHVAELGEKRRF